LIHRQSTVPLPHLKQINSTDLITASAKGLSWWHDGKNAYEIIAAAQAERRAKIAAAHAQALIAEENRLIAEKKKRQLEKAKPVLELDRKLIVIVVLIVALPIIAALAWMLTALAVGHGPQ
jgi:hypothetical protein